MVTTNKLNPSVESLFKDLHATQEGVRTLKSDVTTLNSDVYTLKIGVATLVGDQYKTKALQEVGNCSLGEYHETDDVTEETSKPDINHVAWDINKANDEIIIESEASRQQHHNHNLHIREVKAVVCTKAELYTLSATEDVHIEFIILNIRWNP